jgi:hypothetical protein
MVNAQECWRQITERTHPLDALITLMIVAVLVVMMIRPQDRAILGYPLAVLFGLLAGRRALSSSRDTDRVPGAPRTDAAALELIGQDKSPYSPRLRPLKSALAKFGPPEAQAPPSQCPQRR